MTAPLAAQALGAPERLAFWGYSTGTSLGLLDERSRFLGGEGLACRTSATDRRVTECRAVGKDPGSGRTVYLWLSAIDSAAAILTISGVVTGEQLTEWRRGLEENYGHASVAVQGSQRMMQWTRLPRTLRLTWRTRGAATAASVSLVDQNMLDAWGRARRARTNPGRSTP